MKKKHTDFRTREDGTIYPIDLGKNHILKATEAFNKGKIYPIICRQCNASVFYYENDNGSKVFFDRLGEPWPKHLCNSLQEENRKISAKVAEKIAKKKSEKENLLRARLENNQKTPLHSLKAIVIKASNDKGYPLFQCQLYERVLFQVIGVSNSRYRVYQVKDIFVDSLKRREVTMITGYDLNISEENLKVLRSNYYDMPVYIVSSNKHGVNLVTHILRDGHLETFQFLAEYGESCEKILGELILGF